MSIRLSLLFRQTSIGSHRNSSSLIRRCNRCHSRYFSTINNSNSSSSNGSGSGPFSSIKTALIHKYGNISRNILTIMRYRSSYYGPPTWETRIFELRNIIRRRILLLKGNMVKRRNILFTIPFGIGTKNWSYSLSDLCGHGAFLMLGLSYLETEIFNLRLFAASGITLSIIFQYYREKPLWIPIRWNTMFLFINGIMITHILKEESDVKNIPQEQMQLYNTLFKNRGMKPVDFLHLMSIAQRHELKKGEILVTNGVQHHHLHLVHHGRLSVKLNNEKMKDIKDNQFAGAVSFLNWQGDPENRNKVKKKIEDHQYHLYYGSEDFTNFFNFIGSLTASLIESEILEDVDGIVSVQSDYKSKGNDKKDKKTVESTATYEGAIGHADVTAEEDCVVFSWDFIELDEVYDSYFTIYLIIIIIIISC